MDWQYLLRHHVLALLSGEQNPSCDNERRQTHNQNIFNSIHMKSKKMFIQCWTNMLNNKMFLLFICCQKIFAVLLMGPRSPLLVEYQLAYVH